MDIWQASPPGILYSVLCLRDISLTMGGRDRDVTVNAKIISGMLDKMSRHFSGAPVHANSIGGSPHFYTEGVPGKK